MKTLFIFLFLVSQLLWAQQLTKVSELPLDASSFVGIDFYKNLYFTKDLVLHKTGPEGSFVFNDYQLGRIKTVDIINPLKILVFYQGTNTVVFFRQQVKRNRKNQL